MSRRPSARAGVGLVAAGLLAALASSVVGCGAGLRRFPAREVVWTDPDTRPFEGPPEGFYSSYSWDGADNAVFRPLAEFWTFETSREAWNVNAMDEVPSSSWYQNRLSVRTWTPARVARGACDDLDDELPGPWRIVGGKPDGANPGFQIVDGEGVRYLMKTDGDLQAERPSAADVVGALVWHAAGFNVPCNRVVVFDRAVLELDPDATIERTDGSEEPLTEADVDAVLEKATRLPDGRYRASVSQFIDGRPISPWRYHGRRDGDPNDVVPHEHRRDLRGQYVLSAWLDHIDARQENTMAAWVDVDGDAGELGYVRHYMIDFGDTLGIIHSWDPLVRRFGHSGYLDVGHILTDFFTLGMLDRPWHHAEHGLAGETLGYFDVQRFVPDRWRPGYANNAYDRMTERDAAWMTRIIARFRDPLVRAVVERARFTDPQVTRELERILVGRRDRILERWLTRLSPLTWPEIRRVGGRRAVCLQDLAVWTGIRERRFRVYATRAFVGDDYRPVEAARAIEAEDAYVCVPIPAVDEDYLVLDVFAATPERRRPFPARLHLRRGADGELALVGLGRPDTHDPPSP
ncbi:MAG TPA: hypothetical protein RMH99_11895 [Sandaracinaceae bacterium LLY-WYZ-13_1]|nr:hypothetical protein [Sandaracinaceae bacterium LLY-WYZ-13_1]